jgi:hypothetical protein
MALRLRDAVNQPSDQRDQRREEPEPPPQRTRVPLHHLVTAESAEAVEWTRDPAAAPALVELKAAMRATRLVCVVEHHGRLIAARTQARGDEG